MTGGAETCCVVTVTYGDRFEFLRVVLHRVLSLGVGKVIVVDNHSTAASREALRQTEASSGGRVSVVYMSDNQGSAGGFAAGLQRAAQCDRYEYVWCLDDDNLPHADALEHLLDARKLVEDGAALLAVRTARPRLTRRASGATIEETFGRRFSFLGFSVLDVPRKVHANLAGHVGGGAERGSSLATGEAAPSGEVVLDIPYAPYGGFFFKRSLLSDIGVPRADFYLYADDFEFTRRFVALGHPIYLVPRSRVDDIEQSWDIERGIQRRWTSGRLLADGDENLLLKSYYSIRNHVYFECYSLKYKWNALYVLNALVYVLILLLQTLYQVGRGRSFALSSLKTILRAIADARRGRLGRRVGSDPVSRAE